MKNLNQHIVLVTFLLFLCISVFAGAGTNNSETGGVRTIEITGTDRMQFDVTEITAGPGERIRIVLTTISKIPKVAMAHNVVIMDKGTDIDAFVNASAMARDNGYIAPEYKDQIIAATDLAGGGETVEVTFTVPEDSGEYIFICTFPGHYMAGMKGTLKVS